MTAELWHATVNPRGPNHLAWAQIFGEGRVPLKSSKPITADLGPERDVEVYMLDLAALTLSQRSALLAQIAQRFRVPIFEVEAELAKVGFPIRAADVIVSYGMRAFV